MNAGSPQPLMPHGWDERHRVRTARIAQRPSGMMCARREAGARRPALSTSAPSTSAESPRAPEPRRRRFGARLFLLPPPASPSSPPSRCCWARFHCSPSRPPRHRFLKLTG